MSFLSSRLAQNNKIKYAPRIDSTVANATGFSARLAKPAKAFEKSIGFGMTKKPPANVALVIFFLRDVRAAAVVGTAVVVVVEVVLMVALGENIGVWYGASWFSPPTLQMQCVLLKVVFGPT